MALRPRLLGDTAHGTGAHSFWRPTESNDSDLEPEYDDREAEDDVEDRTPPSQEAI